MAHGTTFLLSLPTAKPFHLQSKHKRSITKQPTLKHINTDNDKPCAEPITQYKTLQNTKVWYTEMKCDWSKIIHKKNVLGYECQQINSTLYDESSGKYHTYNSACELRAVPYNRRKTDLKSTQTQTKDDSTFHLTTEEDIVIDKLDIFKNNNKWTYGIFITLSAVLILLVLCVCFVCEFQFLLKKIIL